MRAATRRVQAIQVVMLRLSVDPDFGRRVYHDDCVVIELPDGRYELTAEDLALVRAVDHRAWTTDRFRRARFVQALIEEYLLTTALVGVPAIDAFFSSEAFVHVLSHRGSMAEALGDWLPGRVPASARPFIALEAAVVRARRGVRPEGQGLVAVPGKEGVSLPEGALAHWQSGLAQLGPEALKAVAEGRRWQAPKLSSAREYLLIERNEQGGLGVHVMSAGVIGVLAFCRSPRSRSAVSREARRLKVPKKRVSGLLRRMLHEGLLLER